VDPVRYLEMAMGSQGFRNLIGDTAWAVGMVLGDKEWDGSRWVPLTLVTKQPEPPIVPPIPRPEKATTWVRTRDGFWFDIVETQGEEIYYSGVSRSERGMITLGNWAAQIRDRSIAPLFTVKPEDWDRTWHTPTGVHPGTCKGCNANPETWGMIRPDSSNPGRGPDGLLLGPVVCGPRCAGQRVHAVRPDHYYRVGCICGRTFGTEGNELWRVPQGVAVFACDAGNQDAGGPVPNLNWND
jgi:hypothetical protein